MSKIKLTVFFCTLFGVSSLGLKVRSEDAKDGGCSKINRCPVPGILEQTLAMRKIATVCGPQDWQRKLLTAQFTVQPLAVHFPDEIEDSFSVLN
jgi:hypothetical protein